MKINFIKKTDECGTLKTDSELEEELETLLNLYRRNNLILNDRIYNLEQNLFLKYCYQNISVIAHYLFRFENPRDIR